LSNIILTTNCQRKCKYCFAKDNVQNEMSFSIENFIKVIDWMVSSREKITRVGFLGGEPTSHPDFVEFLDYTLSKRLSVLVFTNGMVDNSELFSGVIETAKNNEVTCFTHLGFCLNVNEQKYRSRKEEELQNEFLIKLGRVTNLSFNIFEESFDPYFLLNIINKYNTIRHIRLGLAAPLGNSNACINPINFNVIAEKIVKFINVTKKNNIDLNFDCGFPLCMFSDEALAKFVDSGTKAMFSCEPIIDVYPNLEAAYCYPLSRQIRANIADYESYIDLHHEWFNKFKNTSPMYDKCVECNYYKQQICGGGCKAHKING